MNYVRMYRSMRLITILFLFGLSTTITSNQSWATRAFKKTFLMLEKQAKHEAQIWHSGIKSLFKRFKGDSLTKYESIYFDAFKKRALFTAAITLFSSLSTVIWKIKKKRKTNRENIDLNNNNETKPTPSQDEENTTDHKDETAKLNTKKKASDEEITIKLNNDNENNQSLEQSKKENDEKEGSNNMVNDSNKDDNTSKKERGFSAQLDNIQHTKHKKLLERILSKQNDGKYVVKPEKKINKEHENDNNKKVEKHVSFNLPDKSEEESTTDEESITDFEFESDSDESESKDDSDIEKYIAEQKKRIPERRTQDDLSLLGHERKSRKFSYTM